MYPPLKRERLERWIQQIHPNSRLLRPWRLRGGVSARVIALEIRLADGRTTKMVLRQHGEADRNRNPQIAADEYQLLRLLREAEIPIPSPFDVDPSTSSILMEFVEGESGKASTHPADFLWQLANHLARIHRVDIAKWGLSFLPAQEKRVANTQPKEAGTSEEERIRRRLEKIGPLPSRNPPRLLHGDYWPGNTLWKDGRLIAIIDWEDAAQGDPLADVANCRLELLWALGTDAMVAFTHHYRSIMAEIDFTHLPYWELCAALPPISKISTWKLDPATEQTMRKRLKQFVDRALIKTI